MSKRKYVTGHHASLSHSSIGIPGLGSISKTSISPTKGPALSTNHEHLFALLSENSSTLGPKSLRSQAFLAKSKAKPTDKFIDLTKEFSIPAKGPGSITKPSIKTSSTPSKTPTVERSSSTIPPKNNNSSSNNNDETQQQQDPASTTPYTESKLVSPHLQTIARLRSSNNSSKFIDEREDTVPSSEEAAAVALTPSMRMKSSNEALWQSVKGTTLARYRRLIGTVARKHLKNYFTTAAENVARFRLETLAAKRIQRLVRSFLCWQKEVASIMIQSLWRSYMIRQLYREMKAKHLGAIKFQSHVRKYHAMQLKKALRKEKQESAVIKIQSRVRSFHATRLKRKQKEAIVLIQTHERRRKQQQMFHQKKKACHLIQKQVRQYQERQRQQFRLEEQQQQKEQKQQEKERDEEEEEHETEDPQEETIIVEIESLSALSSPPPSVGEQPIAVGVLEEKEKEEEPKQDAQEDADPIILPAVPSLVVQEEQEEVEVNQETNDNKEILVQQLRERVARRKLQEFASRTVVPHVKARTSACIVLQGLCRRLQACREVSLRREIIVTSLRKQLELTWTTEGPCSNNTCRPRGPCVKKYYRNLYTEEEQEDKAFSSSSLCLPLFLSPHDPQSGILPTRHGDLPWYIRSVDTFSFSSLYIFSIE